MLDMREGALRQLLSSLEGAVKTELDQTVQNASLIRECHLLRTLVTSILKIEYESVPEGVNN